MKRVCLVLTLCAGAALAPAQEPDARIAAYVNSIKAIDNHSHVPAVDREHDRGYDQLRCDALPPATGLPPAGLRFGADKQAGYRTLYGFEALTGSEAEIRQVTELQAAARREHGASIYAWVMEKAGIETVLANRTAMAPEMKAPQLRWAPYADALLFPLDNGAVKALNPDRRALFGMAEELRNAYLLAAGLKQVPATLNEYLDKVVRATLRTQKSAGALAIKFEAAYLRSLAFGPASKAEAARVYAKYAGGGAPGAGEYTRLQDFLFKQIAIEAGRLGLVVHFHTGTGCGEFFEDSGADAMLLSPALNDPELRSTRFVLLHGNQPRHGNVSLLILKPNVYADMSVLEYFTSPTELARILRPWLEIMPEHVMFGSDAGPFGPGLDWEETTVIGARNVRRALALVLSEMMRDGTLTESRAKDIAEMVLRGNAKQLYGLD
jgi:hypothetical protein